MLKVLKDAVFFHRRTFNIDENTVTSRCALLEAVNASVFISNIKEEAVIMRIYLTEDQISCTNTVEH